MNLALSLYTCMYLEAFTTFFKITKAEDGTYAANWPLLASDGPLWTFTVGDTGRKPSHFVMIESDLWTFTFTLMQVLGLLKSSRSRENGLVSIYPVLGFFYSRTCP